MSQSTELPELPERDGDWAGDNWYTADTLRAYTELAIASVKREPLSEEVLRSLYRDHYFKIGGYIDFARAIEQAHGITKENNGS